MNCQSSIEPIPTEPIPTAVECRPFGWDMVRDLESFLGTELAKPQQGRCISFLATPHHRATGDRVAIESNSGNKPW